MCEFDDMKNRFRVESYRIHGVVYKISSVPDLKVIKTINCNKTHQLLSNYLCESGNVVCHKMSKGDGYITVSFGSTSFKLINDQNKYELSENHIVESTLPQMIILNGLRIYRRVFVPNLLYLRKYDIEDELKGISRKFNVDAELSISHDVFIYIVGLDLDVRKAMIEIYKMIESFMDRNIHILSGYYKVEDLRKVFSGGIYLLSRINCNEIVLTGNDSCIANLLEGGIQKKEHNHLLEKTIIVETLKLIYLFYYKRPRIEDILADCECYLIYNNEVIGSEYDTTLRIKGFYEILIKKCVKKFRELFQETIKMIYSDTKIKKHVYEIFTFCIEDDNDTFSDENIYKYGFAPQIAKEKKDEANLAIKNIVDEKTKDLLQKIDNKKDFQKKKLFLSIGLRSDIKDFINQSKLVENSIQKNIYEIEIEIDHDLEDFLCGKKNGKINKICKDNECDVQITTKKEESTSTDCGSQNNFIFERSIESLTDDLIDIKLDHNDETKNKSFRYKNGNKNLDGYFNYAQNRYYPGSYKPRLYTKQMNIYVKGICSDLYNTICQLECEFPAEISFHLPEKHHRRIIGYGGKNIQKIMKKHGVYIKFMNEEERSSLGYNGNVVIKTPKRNKESLLKMKEEVLCLADEQIKVVEQICSKMNLFYFFEFEINNPYRLLSEFALVYDIDHISNIKTFKLLPKDVTFSGLYKSISSNFSTKRFTKLLKMNNDIYLITEAHNVFGDDSSECDQMFYKSNLEKCFNDHFIINSSSWLDTIPKLSFSLFDSKLFYTHEATVKQEFTEIDNYRVDFKNRNHHGIESNNSTIGNKRSDEEKPKGK